MSGRVLLLDADRAHDVFDVVDLSGSVVRARSAFLFEVGEELRLRIERDGAVRDVTARVRGHVGDDDHKITELELVEPTEQKP